MVKVKIEPIEVAVEGDFYDKSMLNDDEDEEERDKEFVTLNEEIAANKGNKTEISSQQSPPYPQDHNQEQDEPSSLDECSGVVAVVEESESDAEAGIEAAAAAEVEEVMGKVVEINTPQSHKKRKTVVAVTSTTGGLSRGKVSHADSCADKNVIPAADTTDIVVVIVDDDDEDEEEGAIGDAEDLKQQQQQPAIHTCNNTAVAANLKTNEKNEEAEEESEGNCCFDAHTDRGLFQAQMFTTLEEINGAITAAYGFLSTYTAQVSRHIELLDELGTKEYKDVCDKTEKKKQKADVIDQKMKDVAAIVQEQAQQLKRKLCHEGEDDEEEHDDSNDDSKGDSNNNGSEDENSTNDDNEAMRMHVR